MIFDKEDQLKKYISDMEDRMTTDENGTVFIHNKDTIEVKFDKPDSSFPFERVKK